LLISLPTPVSLVALGLNHETAPVAVRERLALDGDGQRRGLQQLKSVPGIQGAALVSTCNRTELYCRTAPGQEQLPLDWLKELAREREVRIGAHLYRHDNDRAVRHAFRVATGLDSMVLGEPQILGQMKQAWAAAREQDSLDRTLDRLFQRSFAVAKEVREHTGLGRGAVSVAYAGIKLARQVFDDLKLRQVLVIGAGETGALFARHLRGLGVERLLIANRTYARAVDLAAELQATPVALDRIGELLPQVDVVVGAAAAQILDRPTFVQAYRGRRRRLALMLDLGVPRCLDPALADLDDVILYDVDHLRKLADDGLEQRRIAAETAEDLVSRQVEDFMRWWRSAEAVDPLVELRARNEQLREESLARALKDLERGTPAAEVMAQLAQQLTNRMQHAPTVALRTAIAHGDQAQLALLRHALGLDRRR